MERTPADLIAAPERTASTFMHVAFLSMIGEYYTPDSSGAVATCIMQQARQLLARGHRVTVLAPVNKDATYPVGQFVPLEARQRHQIPTIRRAISRLRRNWNKWDFAYYEFYLNSALAALTRLSPDAIVCFNDLRIPLYLRRAVPGARIAVRLSNEVATRQTDIAAIERAVDVFFPVSSYIRDWLGTHYGIRGPKVVVLSNAADPGTFYPRPDFLRAADPLRVLYLGRIDHIKGPDIAIGAVEALNRQGRPVELTVAGSRWFYNHEQAMADPYVRRTVEDLKTIGATYLGHVGRSQVPALVRAQDVVMIPSRFNDPMPQVIFEAMASGCAVIASQRGGIPEACGQAAILLDPDQPNTFTDALRMLEADRQQLAEYKRRGLARAAAMTWSGNVDVLEAALCGALHQ